MLSALFTSYKLLFTSTYSDGSVLIIDLGHLKVVSDLVSRDIGLSVGDLFNINLADIVTSLRKSAH